MIMLRDVFNIFFSLDNCINFVQFCPATLNHRAVHEWSLTSHSTHNRDVELLSRLTVVSWSVLCSGVAWCRGREGQWRRGRTGSRRVFGV